MDQLGGGYRLAHAPGAGGRYGGAHGPAVAERRCLCSLAVVAGRSWLVAEPLLGDALPGKQSAVASHFTPSTHGRLGTAAVLGRF